MSGVFRIEDFYISILIAILIFCLAVAVAFFIMERKSNSAMRSRFSKILDVDAELVAIKEVVSSLRTEEVNLSAKYKAIETKYKGVVGAEAIVKGLENRADELLLEIEKIRTQYNEKKVLYDKLTKQVAVFDEKLAFAEMGVYEPHFDFTDSEEYKSEVEIVRDEQKGAIRSENAVLCNTTWSVDGSESKGRVMTNRAIKLTLRAFNNECDAAIANTRWNNFNAMEKRIIKARDQINKLNESNFLFISEDYMTLKKKELYLTHEYREKLKSEKEERAEASRSAREEQKLIRDIELAEATEAHYQKLLNRARAEAKKATGGKLDALTDKVKLLEKELADAHASVDRAQAMAERTRCGYIYIISNVGSFGEDVVKIGLTRRLDPMDRIRELGDASVPFVFDTHAIIYSEDAPTLERSLHSEFGQTRVNSQNYRKEFFRASIEAVEAAVKKLAPGAPFFKDIEAQEYRETLARRRSTLSNVDASSRNEFPSAI